MLMTEQVPAEAWHSDVIGPLVPQRRSLFAIAIIEEKNSFSQQSRDCTPALNIFNQLISDTARDNGNKLFIDVDYILILC